MRLLCLSALVLGLSLSACAPRPDNGSAGNAVADSADTTAADTTTDTTASVPPMRDTTTAADSSEEPPHPPSLGDSPAPGSVRVQATASSCKENADGASYQCTLQIEQINAYGPATPRLGKRQALPVLLFQRTLEQARPDARAAMLGGTGSVELTLRHTGERPAAPPPGTPEWEVARIH